LDRRRSTGAALPPTADSLVHSQRSAAGGENTFLFSSLSPRRGNCWHPEAKERSCRHQVPAPRSKSQTDRCGHHRRVSNRQARTSSPRARRSTADAMTKRRAVRAANTVNGLGVGGRSAVTPQSAGFASHRIAHGWRQGQEVCPLHRPIHPKLKQLIASDTILIRYVRLLSDLYALWHGGYSLYARLPLQCLH